MIYSPVPLSEFHAKCRRDFNYSFESGLLKYTDPENFYHKGAVGHVVLCNGVDLGRKRVRWSNQNIMYTDVIWFWIFGEWPEFTIDHLDRNPGNNRIENLRDVTRSIQNKNRKRWGRFAK